MGYDHTGLEWTLNPIRISLISDREGQRLRRSHIKAEAKIGVTLPQTNTCTSGLRNRQKLEEVRKNSSLEPLAGVWLCQHLEFGLLDCGL